MISIPVELLEQFKRNNVIPLVDRGINWGVLPRSGELARQLSKRCDYPANEPETLRRVAGYYELTTGDRHSLIDFLRDRLDGSELEPSRSHRLIARLRPRVVVTVCYDRLLERALREEAVPYTPVVGNEEVAYSDESKTLLVWLWGVIDRPESLIITEDDHRRFLDHRENLSYVLHGELGRRTWLFLGSDPEDEWFRNYYDGATRGLDRHRRRCYIVGRTLSEYARAWWAERAQIFDMDIEPFLIELSQQLAAHQRRETTIPPVTVEGTLTRPQPLPERPYKLLDFYEAKDAPIFFGREAEIQKLSSLIYAHRLVLLYGASGAGKTSLLLAGVVPRLAQAEPGYETVYLRLMDNPLDVIRRTVRRRLAEASLPDDGSLVDFLDAATRAIDRPLVIILDQFEEFFMRFGPQTRQAFITELGALYDARDVPVKIVLSLREDWLASMDEIKERIPEVFYIHLRLLPLNDEQARQAITAPAEKVGISYDRELVDRMLRHLVTTANVDENASINPPQLQLVCDAVYDHARGSGRQHITMADYDSVGGAQGILDRYIEAALDEHRGDDRELAKNVLIALVSSHDTKAKSDLANLATELGEDESDLAPVLNRLTSQRLVRRLDEENAYELAHDILAATITTWIDDEERQVKRVRELLRQELSDWRQDPSALLSHGKFQRINATRDSLRFTEEEAAFLLRAALLYDEDVPYWLDQVGKPDSQINILLETLDSNSAQARFTSAKFLANYPQDRAAVVLAHAALEDPEPMVRDVAAVSLGLMGGQTSIQFLTEVALEKQNPQRVRVLRALARIRDVAPEQTIKLSGTTRFRIIIDLAKIRFRRDWPRIRLVTAAGAFGGAIGFGLGASIPTTLNDLQTTAQFSSPTLLLVQLLALYPPLWALYGLLAGSIMALGISGAESLKRERAGLARILGGTILGGLGFAIILSPLNIVGVDGLSGVLPKIAGGGLFGVLIALGITVPAAFTSRQIAALIGGALGGSLGLVVWGALGYIPLQFETVAASAVIASGGLTGFVLAFSITAAESRQAPGVDKEKQSVLDASSYFRSI
jgi:HEAT repeat protein/energy-coupling factor transporter ATP-binding protein EcfA2